MGMTQAAATNNTESRKRTLGNTEKENKMNMGDRQINPKMRLLLRLQKFAANRALARPPHRRGQGTELGPKRETKGKKIPGLVHKLFITMHLPKNEAKRT
jgi:hypothetical protein